MTHYGSGTASAGSETFSCLARCYKKKLVLLQKKMKIEGFSASNGWLQCFKKQHNLQRINTAGEDGDVNEKVLESWNERAREITREYKPEDV